ncbi:MAG: YggT family protein [Treponemataceae bacterium]
MATIFRILGAFTSIYMLACFVRIMLTWFDGASFGRPYEILIKATDPFLNWFRRFPVLRTESFDFSPVAALTALALTNNVFVTIGFYGKITVGIFLSLVFSGAWSAVSFLLFFFIAVFILRFVSLTYKKNSYLPLWQAVDAISRPILYRINRLVYRDRLVSYQRGIGTSIIILIGANIAGGLLVHVVSGLLVQLPF